MPQTKSLMLANVGDCPTVHVGIFQDLKKLIFALFAEFLFKGWGVVKVILKRSFAARSYKDEFFNACRTCFIDRVLDQRPVNQGHNLFWH